MYETVIVQSEGLIKGIIIKNRLGRNGRVFVDVTRNFDICSIRSTIEILLLFPRDETNGVTRNNFV